MDIFRKCHIRVEHICSCRLIKGGIFYLDLGSNYMPEHSFH
ncbi:hypothetical protein Q671_04595 [Halomonas sp. PBN3]|nr:hypothetical protein Q671_04595 [Halomonas sp. PBN3]